MNPAYEKALEKIGICKKKRLSYLDLRGLGLEEIPEEVVTLEWIGALALSQNSISDLSLLAHMKRLHKLSFAHNTVLDISPLRELSALKFLFMQSNKIESLDALEGSTALKKIVAYDNRIGSLAPLLALPKLVYLDITDNPLRDP